MSSKTTSKPVPHPIAPLGDRILARPIEAETKTKSGIFIPENTAKKANPEIADVVAVGATVEGVKPGDRILYAKYGPDTIKHEGEELLILHEEDCLAVVTE